MLISFTVANYRSFKDPVTLSMVAEKRITGLEDENLIPIPDGRHLLNAAAIYGANASGKSNLVKALHFMRDFVLNSSKESQQGDPIPTEPFLLGDDLEQASHFEIECLLDGVVYEYGFEVTRTEVTKEWLYGSPKGRKAAYFEREGQTWPKMSEKYFKEGVGLGSKTRTNALFLSTVAQFNGETARKIINFLTKTDGPRNSPMDIFAPHIAFQLSKDPEMREAIAQFLNQLDVGITSLRVPDPPVQPSETVDSKQDMRERVREKTKWIFSKDARIKTVHKTPSGREVEFDLLDQESSGSQKLVIALGPIINSLIFKGVQIFDEIESSLHPLLVMELFRFFQVNKTNPSGAQIIFTTHDTNLLSRQANLLRRDQIWFTEKKPDASTDLYCLSEFKDRKEAILDRNYLWGKYGAVPYLGDWEGVLEKKR